MMQISSAAMFGSLFQTNAPAKPQGATGDASWMDAAPTDGVSTVRSEFDAYAKKTPAEKMREAMLKKLGLTEDEYKAMSADERAAVDAKIKAMIKTEIEDQMRKGKTGLFADVTA